MTGIYEFIVMAYVILSVSHLGVQFIFAHLHHIRCLRARKPHDSLVETALREDRFPSVTIIYPIYNESPGVLEQVMESAIACLSIPRLDIIFVDDGSPNIDALIPVYRKYERDGIRVVLKINGGKRDAQYVGFNLAKGDLIITVDSDTMITKEGIYRLVAPMLADLSVGAVSGEVMVENYRTNLLSHLIGLRYWIAFNLERAAQSLFGCILCCSGPFSVYRRSIIEAVKEDYINQRFLGAKCTYGDDRHLTNLVIKAGFKTIYQEGAVAHTYVPETLGEYIVQQNRWNKSFYREMLWTFLCIRKVPFYTVYDMILQPLLFFAAFVAIGVNCFLLLKTQDVKVVVYYFSLLIVMASFRSIYGLLRTRNLNFLKFLFYGFLHIAVLMPVRFKSLLTLKENAWGTRSKKRKSSVYMDFFCWSLLYYMLVSIITFTALKTIPFTLGRSHFQIQMTYTGTLDDFIWKTANSWSFALMLIPFLLLVFVALSFLTGRSYAVAPEVRSAGVNR